MLTTADLPATVRYDPTAPHTCGNASCPDSAGNTRSDTPEQGVASPR